MFDYEKEYAEFSNTVESLCLNPLEKDRVSKEFALFERRGWKKYIAVLTQIMRAVEEDGVFGCDINPGSGTPFYSWALRKYMNDYRRSSIFDHCTRGGDVNLLYDAFRLNIVLLSAREEDNAEIMDRVCRIVNKTVRASGLEHERKMIAAGKDLPDGIRRTRVEFLVLSETPVVKEDLDLIVHGMNEITPSEAERLARYMIIKIRVNSFKDDNKEEAHPGN